MAKRMPPEVLAYLRTMGKAYGKLGGKTAAKNMTAAARKARAKKASMAASKKRTAERLARAHEGKPAKKVSARSTQNILIRDAASGKQRYGLH
jgi:hypothetical protein